MRCEDVRDQLAAYSVDALDVDERDAVDDHLARCSACATELRGFQDVATRLALNVPPTDPPPGLKGRVLAAAAGAPGLTARPWWARFGPALPRLHPATVLAAMALLVALSTVLWAVGLQSQLDEQRAATASLREKANRYDRVVAVLQAPDMQVRPLRGTDLAPTAIGRIYVDPDTGAGMMMVRSLPPLAEGRAYQLWWVRADGRRESGGLIRYLDAHGNGYALIQCPGQLGAWQMVGVTEEPVSGSPGPTGQRFLGGPI